MKAFDLEAVSASFFAYFARGAGLLRIWRTAKCANQ